MRGRHVTATRWVCALWVLCAIRMAAWGRDDGVPGTFHVTLSSAPGAPVPLPGLGNGIVVPPRHGQWGFLVLPVEPTIPPGTVTLTVRYFGDPGRQAQTLLYVSGAEGNHLPPYGLRLPPAADGAEHEATFTLPSATPVQSVILKRGDGGAADTLPVLAITIAWTEPQPDPRVRAYQLLLQRPSLFGVVSRAPRSWLDEAEKASLRPEGGPVDAARQRTERWLAAESHLAAAADEAGYLRVAARLLREGRTEADQLGRALGAARGALNRGETEAAEALLGRLEALAGGLDARLAADGAASILPQRQPVVATWLKSFSLAGFAAEPTPLSLRWQGGLSCALTAGNEAPTWDATGGLPPLPDAELARGFTVERSWTGNVWRGPSFSMRVSVLTPLVVLEDMRRGLRLSLAASRDLSVAPYSQLTGEPAAGLPDLASGQAAVLRASGGDLLVIPAGRARMVVKGQCACITCPDGDGLALVALPPSAPTRDAVRFWSRVAASPPEACVQTYHGGRMTLRYDYRRRPHPAGIAGLRIAPLPPLLRLAQGSGWNLELPATAQAPASWREPGFEYAIGDHLACDVPPMCGSGLCGTNLDPARVTDAVYAELAQRGATSVRLALQDGRDQLQPLAASVVCELRDALAACRRHGLRANVDLHGLGETDAAALARPGAAQERAAIWRDVAAACRGYEDALKCYDLTNEPQAQASDQEVWLCTAQACVDAVRRVDARTPILVEAAQGANPSGFPTLRPLQGANLIYGVHYYYPHGFTHQRINGAREFGAPEASPYKLYPGWVPCINWKDEGWFTAPYEWWDRWELAGSAVPVFEFLIRYRRSLDMGEFGVVGHAFDGAGPSASRWTRDVIALADRWGASWDLWGYGTGFGWYGDVPQIVTDAWQTIGHPGAGPVPRAASRRGG